MKNSRQLGFVGMGVLLGTLVAAPGALPGQNPPKTAEPAAPQVPSAAPGGTDSGCRDTGISAEQLENMARTIEQGLPEKLADLPEHLPTEAVMASPQFARLQSQIFAAQLKGYQSELQSKADEFVDQARELAAQVQSKTPELFAQEPGVLISSADEGSGWLGVEIGEVTPDKSKDRKLSSARGVIVTTVEPDSPAAKAGLKENDVITQYDGQAVGGTVQFRRLVRETPPGRTVALVVSRDGASQSLSVELGDRNALLEQQRKEMQGRMRDFGNTYAFTMPQFDLNFGGPNAFEFSDARTPILGISAEDLSGQLGAYFGAPDGKAILVREVRPGTPAEKAGLKAGDVIMKLDGNPIHSLAELREQLRAKSGQQSLSVGILRKGSEMSVPVTIEKPHPLEPLHAVHRAQL
jgi:serine protease Do